ncbi:MAG: DUF3576 domain-containing protein [Rhodospirillaceae bacterium]
MERCGQRSWGGELAGALALALVIAGCSSNTGYEPVANRENPEERDTIFSEGGLGLALFGDEERSGTQGAVAVNAFLWRASLDTIAFMPLASVDPFGGVIITDWYAPPETPSERFKVNVYILGRTLRADGLRVSVFRQTLEGTGWRDAAVGVEVPTEFENAILSRARDLRLRAVAETE